MSHNESPRKNEDFCRKLEDLRMKIDLLPETQRPHLHELADTIAAQHHRLQKKKSPSYDAD